MLESGQYSYNGEEQAMESNGTHEMILVQTHFEGEDEWYCPTCGRRFLLGGAPDYKKVVLDQGDAYATHSGAKGGLSLQVAPVQGSNTDDNVRLAPWVDWINSVDFDSLWE